MEEAKLVKREYHYLKRKIKNTIEIEKRNNNLNLDDVLKLSSTWTPLIKSSIVIN